MSGSSTFALYLLLVDFHRLCGPMTVESGPTKVPEGLRVRSWIRIICGFHKRLTRMTKKEIFRTITKIKDVSIGKKRLQ